jgi:hypothetical protein
MGGTGNDAATGLAVDSFGNVYTTGYFSGTADFDPGPGTANLTGLGTKDNQNIFVSKLDSCGNYVWADCMGSTSASYANAIAMDSSGNVYTTGYFGGTGDFDPGSGTANLSSAGGRDVFVSKLDSSGNYVWAQALGGQIGYGIAVDSSGNVYTTGYFTGTADLDPGPGTAYLTAGDGGEIFVSKLNSSGSYVWADRIGGTTPHGIAVGSSGNVCTTGRLVGTADFDPGAGTYNVR